MKNMNFLKGRKGKCREISRVNWEERKVLTLEIFSMMI
jgi:mRNA-degrading endonuclease RelE of RelBE toxin-antitoxin system